MTPDELQQAQQEAKRKLLHGPHDTLIYKPKEKRRILDDEDDPLPPKIPLHPRFEGMWVVGLPGTGKTQLLQYLIAKDLDFVANGNASIIVLDPTGNEPGTLVHNLTRLRRFALGGDLHGRLVFIDPTDRNYALPINLLSLRASLDDDDAVSSAISSYVSIMGGLMGQPLTPYQDPPLRYAVQVALAFPNPNLDTLRRIISPPDKEPSSYWREVADRLHPTVRGYMETTFDVTTVRRSRGEIMSRLYSLAADPIFRRIFEAEETRIDLAQEINEPKVIVINADRDYLRSLKELYGRYFLGLIKAAGEGRPASAIPCFIYIDECDEFVSTDQNAADILLKLRRKRMALILGNQLVSRIRDDEVRQSFLGTAIKFVNCDPDSARELAPVMNLMSESGRADIAPLINRPALNFAYHIRGRMREHESFKVPAGVMEGLPKMTDGEFDEVRRDILNRYYTPIRRQPVRNQQSSPVAVTEQTFSPEVPEPQTPSTAPNNANRSEGATGWS